EAHARLRSAVRWGAGLAPCFGSSKRGRAGPEVSQAPAWTCVCNAFHIDSRRGHPYRGRHGEGRCQPIHRPFVIKRINMNKARFAVALSLLACVFAWPVDLHAASAMYWTDFITGRIERADLDGTARQVVINGPIANPHGVVLDVVNDH